MNQRSIEGNSDANGSLDIKVPYMTETYAQRRVRLESEIAQRAAAEAKPEQVASEPRRMEATLPVKVSRMPGNGSFA